MKEKRIFAVAKWIIFVISFGFIIGDFRRNYMMLSIKEILSEFYETFDLRYISLILVFQIIMVVLFTVSLSGKYKRLMNGIVCIIAILYVILRMILTLPKINGIVSPTVVFVESFYCIPYVLFVILSIWRWVEIRREKLC